MFVDTSTQSDIIEALEIVSSKYLCGQIWEMNTVRRFRQDKNCYNKSQSLSIIKTLSNIFRMILECEECIAEIRDIYNS